MERPKVADRLQARLGPPPDGVSDGLQTEMLVDALSIPSYNLQDGNIAEQSQAGGRRPLGG